MTVAVFSNNTTAVLYLAKEGRNWSRMLNVEAQGILHWAADHANQILTHLMKRSPNVLVDCLSRWGQMLSMG